MLFAPVFLLVVGGVLGGSFWAGYLVARRIVEHPAAVFFVTLLTGLLFVAIVITGIYGACSQMRF